MSKNEPPKALPYQCHLFLPLAPSFFFSSSKPLLPFPSKLANKAIGTL